ncbi:B3 domain-containing protein REM10-like [Lycium barbarum]|uniref:B3 domain-containing protein REM10-like n=1 Tax=Lycium barbarum TaxID=112863 RepID=UPI00293F445A|nr:B3 domain-containing protein REM10-like [Lycium barbarum]
MEIPPKKSHFFKPILPGFKNGLNIPIGFLKYLKGHDHIEHAILRRADRKWLVKLNGSRLEEDKWNEFVEELNLQIGDILVFKHEGDMEFDVSIFDSTQCDREYAEHMQTQEEEEDEDKDDDEEEEEEEEESVTHDKLFGQSHFECTIRRYCLSKGFLYLNCLMMRGNGYAPCQCVPKHFANENGLITNKKYGLIIRDERQIRSWNLRLNSCKTQVYIGDGWRKFSSDNCLKEGDHITFEVVTSGETPIWKFHVVTDAETPMRKFQEIDLRLKTSGTTTPKSQVAASTSADVNPHFISTIKPYTIRSSVLYLPMNFVKSNGLMDKCEMILVDGKKRSWSVWLGRMDPHFGIKRGWRQFIKANGIQVGDPYKFELTNNGTIPTVHLHCE